MALSRFSTYNVPVMGLNTQKEIEFAELNINFIKPTP